MQQNSDHWRPKIGTRSLKALNITGSEVKPFLAKLYRIVNCWTCLVFLPCASPFVGGLYEGEAVMLWADACHGRLQEAFVG